MHIPFCEKKCRYCDFYSACTTDELLNRYTKALTERIKEWGGKYNRPIDTVYFGGGTPSLLGERLICVMNAVNESFHIAPGAEITLEINPAGNAEYILSAAKAAGVNRLSIGMQSASDKELKILGRTHTVKDIEKTFSLARNLGFSNISLDLMSALPFSNNDTLRVSLDFITELSPEHVSAYMLSVEKNTVFFREKDNLALPDDDSAAEQYLFICETLEKAGYEHYEISNFCKPDFSSRHNLKYWRGAEYLGIGAAAHSYIGGKRFYYPCDLKGFISGDEPVFDSDADLREEFIMLRLRLKSGVNFKEYFSLFGEELPKSFIFKCENFEKAGLAEISGEAISLTDRGMLVSNTVIGELLECVE